MGDAAAERKRSALVWGIFLGVSWTWCIGMFLPVLLVRDLGPAAFVIFAVPNVLGAAAMGWVLERPGHSESWIAQHQAACRAFSVVTILFHVFFSGWIISLLVGVGGGVAAVLLAAVLWAAGRIRRHRDVTAAVVVYVVSLICAGLFLAYGRAGLPGLAYRLDGADWKALWLAPVCLFGFGLCPYLDLTFHRARQAVDSRGAKVAFGLGFGVFFFSMILFTLLYSGVMTLRLEGEMIGRAATVIGVHMLVQSGYTIAAHMRLILPPGNGETQRLGLFTAAAIGIVAAVWWLTASAPRSGEIPYLLFMGFYGLVFPLYVWAALLGRGRIRTEALLVGIVAAAPWYYVGFVGRQTVWLLLGVAIAIGFGVISAVTSRPRIAAS